MILGNLKYVVDADLNPLKSKLGEVTKVTDKYGDSVKRIGGLVAGYFGTAQLMSFAGSIISIRSEFEKYQAVLGNSLGSHRAAADAMGMLQKFATETPFQLTELTDAYVRLINRGLRPSKDELTKLGDFASATGKGFNQLNEAIMDINNQERWKEFGVKVQTIGDRVKLTFKGITQETDRTAEGVMKAIESFGGMEGVAGTMAVQMDTLGGKVSNLKDAWDQFLTKLGDTSIWKDAVMAATDAVTGISNLLSGGKAGIEAREELSKKVDDYTTRLKAAIKESGNLKDAQKLLEDQSQAAMDLLIKLEKQRDIIQSGSLSPKEKIEIIGQEAWDKGVAGGVEKQIKLIRAEYDATMEFIKNNSLIDAIINPKDPNAAGGTNPVSGLIPKIEASIKKLEAHKLTLFNENDIQNTERQIAVLKSQLESLSNWKGNIPEPLKPLELSVISSGNTIAEKLGNIKSDFSIMASDVKTVVVDLNGAFQDLAAGAIVNVAESIGNMFSGGSIKEGLDSLLLMVADWAIKLGSMMIAAGIAASTFWKALMLNPGAAIAIGAALVVAGAAVRGAMASPSESGSKSTSGSSGSSNNGFDANGMRGIRGMTVEVNGVLKAQGRELVAVISSENSRKGL